MKVLVTGGAGFIGSQFVRSVLGGALDGLAGARVTVLDKLTHAGRFANLAAVTEHERLDFVPGDICDSALVDAVTGGHDMIVTFAHERAAAGLATTNVLGTQVLLDAARRHGVTRFLQVSTEQVYGSIGAGAWTERSPVAPPTPYAATKAGADLLALAHHRTHDLPVVVTRSAGTYGPYQHPEQFIARFVTGLLSGRTVPLSGGSQVRDWVHVEDHCRGVALALTRGTPGEIYHIGGTAELSNRDLAGRLLELCRAGWDRVVDVPDGRGHDNRYALADDKIRRELGYRPRIDVDAGLAATVRWYRDNEEWWRPLISD
ncbi:MAG TPA: dTDP-glucose 4,6-dehydratase [Actinoplanes sp.]|nr:dTDP-glucose 4,6-dehydratase [Actinoplanes sp.]